MPPSFAAWQPYIAKQTHRRQSQVNKTLTKNGSHRNDSQRNEQTVGLGILGTGHLLAEYPCLLNGTLISTVLCHKRKALELLPRIDAAGVRDYLGTVSPDIFITIVCMLLDGVSRSELCYLVDPLINDAQARHIAAAIISHVRPQIIDSLLPPLLSEPVDLLRHALVAVLKEIRHPGHLGEAINNISPDVLLCIIRELSPSEIALLVAELQPDDLNPQGALVALMHYAAEDPVLLKCHILPLIRRVLQQGDAKRLVLLLRQLKFSAMEPMLTLLRTVETDRMCRLASNANPAVVAMLVNGPAGTLVNSQFDLALHVVLDGLADAVSYPLAASVLRTSTDLLSIGMTCASSVPSQMYVARRRVVGRCFEDGSIRKAMTCAAFLKLCAA